MSSRTSIYGGLLAAVLVAVFLAASSVPSEASGTSRRNTALAIGAAALIFGLTQSGERHYEGSRYYDRSGWCDRDRHYRWRDRQDRRCKDYQPDYRHRRQRLHNDPWWP
jgi:hypothetical protein